MARPRHARRPRVEPLEPRLALSTASLSGGVLTITGTDGPDRILIGRASAQRIVLTLDGRLMGGLGPVNHIVVNAGAGNDTVLIGSRVTLPSVIHGEAGKDRLRGGAGADLVFGDDGDDILNGSAGRDALDAGTGVNRLAVPRKMGVIHSTSAASGAAIRVLSKSYTLRRLGNSDAAVVGPIVAAASDLSNDLIVAQLRAAYQAGQTVALTEASFADVARLGSLLGHRGGATWDANGPRADLVAFRKSIRDDGGLHSSVKLLMPRVKASTAAGDLAAGRRKADEYDTQWLSGVFATLPVLPRQVLGNTGPLVSAAAASPAQDLTTIAESTEVNHVNDDEYGNQVQVTNMTYGVRSFDQQQDFYYVFQEADYRSGITRHLRSWNNTIASNWTTGNATPTLIQPSPASTLEATTETTSVSWSVSGSVGWNQKQGVNASVSGGVTVTHSKTTTIPPVQIINAADLGDGSTYWSYGVNELPKAQETLSFYNQWVWGFYTAGYGSNSYGGMTFETDASLAIQGRDYYSIPLTVSAVVPQPFGTTYVPADPVILAVAPTFVYGGDQFTIEGTGLYPGLVEDVFIDGIALDPSQYELLTENQISVTAPNYDGFAEPVSVRTSRGFSNNNVTIAIASI